MIKPGVGKGRSDMAHRAILGGRNVGRAGFGIFAGSRYAIVARCAVIDNTRVIKYRGGKSTGDVTDTAILVGHNVTDMLADSATRATVMTGIASFTDNLGAGMINKSTGEINGVMARPAILGRTLMKRCFCRPSGASCNIIYIAIMARDTIACDIRVSKN